MVHVITHQGEKIYVANRIARMSNLFASMMDDNGDEDIPLPWSADQVHQVIHILTNSTINQWFPKLESTRAVLTAISAVLPLLDFIDAQFAMTLIHEYIRQTFASCSTPDDIIQICFDPSVFAALPTHEQRATFEICLTYFFTPLCVNTCHYSN